MTRRQATETAAIDPVHRTIRSGLDHLVSIQGRDGSWRGDYSGPMFLLPMYVAACRIADREIPAARRRRMVEHLLAVQNDDGSIGLHAEDSGSMFTTVLGYVALRFLGVEPEHHAARLMCRWIADNGTALGTASWGKLILAVLSLYPYEGLNPILPELWLMPHATPFHPARLWCHCRQVYLPMAYLYGRKAAIEDDDLIRQLREELYDRPYETIDFIHHRETISPSDNRFPVSRALRLANRLMTAFESHHPSGLRERAMDQVYDHVKYEDRTTSHIDIGPVNSILNAIAHHFAAPGSSLSEQSFAALDGYLCPSPEGLKFNGYNSTALWDTAFAVQAIVSTPFTEDYSTSLALAHRYIRENQVVEDVPERERYFRHASRGGWPFSDREHGWPIADCTAEGFKCAVALEDIGDEPIDEQLLQASVELILSFQNRDGGWATYERQRAGAWLELFNPSQVFGDIMVDYSYVECTSSCIQALARARGRFPGRLSREIDRAVRRGLKFIRSRQRPDGAWQGSWAVCFTYGTWFGVWGLLAGGVPRDAEPIRRACGFLLQRQNRDGGWGESQSSCVEGRYVRDRQSRVVHTSWALMALARAGLANGSAARRAAGYLVDKQLADGDWPVEPLVGVFNKTAMINYENYRRYFPIWALAEFEAARGIVRSR
jgi:squalene/oxidosqualene cyclase-like protein